MPLWLACLAALPVDFELPDARGAARPLRAWRDARVVVVAFLGCDCPVARRYAQRLEEVRRDFAARGVAVVGVDANPGDRPGDVARFEKELRLGYPVLLDAGQDLADRLGVTRQPEVLVLDAARVVRYRGRVDDQYAPGSHRPRAGRADLVRALEELLAGKPVSVPRTEPAGCPLERAARPRSRPAVTYHQHVAPVLNRHCVACHRSGGIGPFSLADAGQAARRARAVREAVADRRMPPWHADPRFGRFANDPSLTAGEVRLIEAWAAAGAPAGEPGPAPPPPLPPCEWAMRTPDRVVSMPLPFKLPASGEIPYQTIEVDPGFTEDVWVQEAEIRPGNRAVVHHCTVFLRPPGAGAAAAQGELQSFCLCAYATGTPPLLLPAGMAKKVPAGWRLVFVVHYVAAGPGQEDQTSVGLKFLPASEVRREVATNLLVSEDLKIPPRCPDHVESRSRTFERDVLLLALFPHMHLRGVSFRYEARYPDGRAETLLHVPKWDMAWQHRYVLAEPKRLPAGTTLTATAQYDNSAANPNNPDPDAEVRAGPRTEDEMFNGYYDFCLAEEVPPAGPNSRPLALALAAGVLVGAWALARRIRGR